MNMIIETKIAKYQYNGEEKEFNCKTSLTPSEQVQFINNVTDTIMGDNYYSNIRPIIFGITMVNIFTDIDTSEIINSPNSLDNIADFLTETGIVNIIKSKLTADIIDILNSAIDDNLEYRKYNRRSVFEEKLAELITTIENKLSEVDVNDVISTLADNVINTYANSDEFAHNHEQAKNKRNEHIEKITEIIENRKTDE